ncbi:TIGR04282 family arsenosugar biosynthesis glycosyltransferase [uncultured Anaerococcus sp.]|uniref:TIGR04282 family arsenosugar biosynthesis glycosyltransferase n=1 Tax=uncultured Anaerococcus sp. TaxID=293428 RepID=UPI00260C4D45|nr:TIGR04282 family arsenosugar biosynthesis glycosyltransferase [uncultured Anaerococcus sp.]
MDKIILFTKAPNKDNCKTRLASFLSDKERLDLMKKLIKKNYDKAKSTNFDLVIYYDGVEKDLSFLEEKKRIQEGSSLGYRMRNAIFDQLDSSNKVVLMGTDLENLTISDINHAFDKLDTYDIVISPTIDGGFGLIGMKEKLDIFTDITYSTPTVYSEIIEKINNFNKKYFALPTIRDIDNMKDLVVAEFNDDNVENLGSGEYNLNYKLDDKVIRINLASQIGLGKKQLKYEYDSLKILEKSNSTPKVYDYYEKGKYLPKSFLTMQYIEGRPLEYDTDIAIAAKLLSSVHNLKTDYSHFIYAEKPFLDMYNEFITMFNCYESYENKDIETENRIKNFLKIAKESGLDSNITNPCIINTELNNRNFIIGDESVIIDWEKPIIGECEQDLAHFLAPTTTNWKTETILPENEMLNFLNSYEKYRKVDYDKFYKYLMFNVLRGLTWCSMAKVEYEEGRFINNPETYEKINKFLSKDFLDMVEVFFRRYDG